MASAVTGFLTSFGLDEPMGSYDDIHRASIEAPEAFWAEAARDIDWDRPWPEEERAPELMNLHEYPPYLDLTEEQKDEFWLHMNSWSLSQFLHGEQGALLVA